MVNSGAKQITRTYTYKCSAKSEDVFRLLSPYRQFEWIPEYRCEIIYSESAIDQQGCMFRSRNLYGREIIWVTTIWDPEDFTIEFVGIAYDLLIIRLNISFKDNLDGTTNVKWKSIFVPISNKGKGFVENYLEGKFNQNISLFEKALSNYLETDKLLTRV